MSCLGLKGLTEHNCQVFKNVRCEVFSKHYMAHSGWVFRYMWDSCCINVMRKSDAQCVGLGNRWLHCITTTSTWNKTWINILFLNCLQVVHCFKSSQFKKLVLFPGEGGLGGIYVSYVYVGISNSCPQLQVWGHLRSFAYFFSLKRVRQSVEHKHHIQSYVF